MIIFHPQLWVWHFTHLRVSVAKILLTLWKHLLIRSAYKCKLHVIPNLVHFSTVQCHPCAWGNSVKFFHPASGEQVIRVNLCSLQKPGCLSMRQRLHKLISTYVLGSKALTSMICISKLCLASKSFASSASSHSASRRWSLARCAACMSSNCCWNLGLSSSTP